MIVLISTEFFCQHIGQIALENMCVCIYFYLHTHIYIHMEVSEVLHEAFLVIRAVVQL